MMLAKLFLHKLFVQFVVVQKADQELSKTTAGRGRCQKRLSYFVLEIVPMLSP